MDEAKIPDDTRDWNSMDIFVFSNGQQYTPPRKYHLRSDELKLWDSTLRYLAHSQYGSLHSSIELYTIEGKKVQGPLELSNDTAYVAVTPPDPFIQSGYDKYLLKASRSREKRQEKRLSATNPSLEDINIIGLTSLNVNKLLKDPITITTQKEKNRGKSSIPIKNTSSSRPNSTSPPTKTPIEKRKILNPRNTVLRKLNNSRKLSNITQSSLGKVTSSVKNSQPINRNTVKYTAPKNKPIAATIFETQLSESKKDDDAKQEEVPTNFKKDISNLYRELSSSNVVLKDALKKNYIDKDVINQNNGYHNLESEPASLFVDADRDLRDTIGNEPQSPHATPLNTSEIDKDSNDYYVNKQPLKFDWDDIEMKNHATAETQKSIISLSDKLFNAYNKECTINFNLNIEVKDGKTNSMYNSNTFNKSYTFNTEMQSQTDLQIELDKEMIKANDYNYSNQHGTMNSFVGRSCYGCLNKVIIIKCSCSDKPNKNSDISGDNNPDNNITFSPEEKNISERVADPSNLKHQDSKEKEGIVNHNNIQAETLVVPKDANNEKDIVKEQKVFVSRSPDVPVLISKSTEDQKKTENTQTLSMPNSTQTDWCNTLVEARCNEDGCYSFHLPSLEKLKQFRL